MTIKLVVCGAGGRMGSRILALARQNRAFEVIYGLESPRFNGQVEGLRTGSDASQIQHGDVVIDFTVADATAQLAPAVAKYKKAYVIGTTGFDEYQLNDIAKAAKEIPVVRAPNMSLGVNVFFKIAQETARALPGYEVEIIETHHQQKKGCPVRYRLACGRFNRKVHRKIR